MIKQLFDLSGRTALITGGSRGLGFQIAEGIVEMGGRVILTARKAAELDEAEAQLKKFGAEASTIACDFQKLDTIPSVASEAIDKFGTVDILINNAGTSWAAPTEEHPLEAWNKVMNLNMTAPFLLCREIGKQSMIPRKTGKILNIASIGGLGGNRADLGMNTIAYNSSKAAVINFTRALATEWGKYNININALCPGFFPSKMSQALMSDIEEKLLPSIPLGRWGGEKDLQGAAVFLVSDAAQHITGQSLNVDGGATA